MLRLLNRKAAPANPKRVLLAWEFGAGRTHYTHLLSVAAHLRASGIECLATLSAITPADREFAAIGVRTVQNYIWPSQRRLHGGWRSVPTHGFTDWLTFVGLGSSSAVAGAIAHYETLFSLFKPDLLLCEQAFGALLAGRDLIPAVVMGVSTGLPPVVTGGFPLQPGRSEPTTSVEALLAGINEGLTLAGRFPLNEIGDLFRIAGIFVFGPRELDMYDSLRREPSIPPTVPGLIEALRHETGGDEVFVYVHGFAQSHPAMMEALGQLGVPVRAFIPDLRAESRDMLTAAGVLVEDNAVPLADILRRSRIVVHHGGVQLTCACLAAGLPQIILAKELDNRISSAFVEGHGLGKAHEFYGIERDWIVNTIRDIYGDAALAVRARDASARFRQWFAVDTSYFVASRIGEILGVAIRPAATRDERTD